MLVLASPLDDIAISRGTEPDVSEPVKLLLTKLTNRPTGNTYKLVEQFLTA